MFYALDQMGENSWSQEVHLLSLLWCLSLLMSPFSFSAYFVSSFSAVALPYPPLYLLLLLLLLLLLTNILTLAHCTPSILAAVLGHVKYKGLALVPEVM
jgi:hypothetical protein